MPFSKAGHLLHPLRRFIHPVGSTLEKFHLRAGDTVLELGPGPGYFTIEASQIVGARGRLLSLDIQRPMVAALRQRLEERGITNAHPMVGDALNLPLADNSIDAAFLVAVLGEIPDQPKALAELRRVLKPGGILSIMETLTDPDYQFEASVRDLCQASGFNPLEHHRQLLGYTMCFGAPRPTARASSA
ncbi:MAG: class I SAM-dependent methyltransferase [Dehalococcoidia bacterium]